MVCIDDSELSRAVLPIARELAQASHADVDLVRVINLGELRGASAGGQIPADARERELQRHPSTVGAAIAEAFPPDEPPSPPPDRFEPRLLERNRLLEQEKEQARQDLHVLAEGFPGEPRLVVLGGGDVEDALIEYARHEHPDVIAMATHSRSAVGKAVFGSTAHAVVSSGVAPVMLVHPSD